MNIRDTNEVTKCLEDLIERYGTSDLMEYVDRKFDERTKQLIHIAIKSDMLNGLRGGEDPSYYYVVLQTKYECTDIEVKYLLTIFNALAHRDNIVSKRTAITEHNSEENRKSNSPLKQTNIQNTQNHVVKPVASRRLNNSKPVVSNKRDINYWKWLLIALAVLALYIGKMLLFNHPKQKTETVVVQTETAAPTATPSITGVNATQAPEIIPSEPLNNTKYDATPLQLNVAMMDNLMSSKDVNWYSFTLDSDGMVYVDFQHDMERTEEELWRIMLFREDGETAFNGELSDFRALLKEVPGDQNYTSKAIGLAAGKYLLCIEPFNSFDYWSGKNYSITVQYTATKYAEKEMNGLKYDATYMELNQSYHGSTTNEYDYDWYRFTLDSDKTISISFHHEFLRSEDEYWTIYLFQSDGSTRIDLNAEDNYSTIVYVKGDSDFDSVSASLGRGDYYILVEPFNSYDYWNNAEYDLTVRTN